MTFLVFYLGGMLASAGYSSVAYLHRIQPFSWWNVLGTILWPIELLIGIAGYYVGVNLERESK